MSKIKIITIDGPASSGKGTIARKLADELGFHYLESGAIYRALGLWILISGIKNPSEIQLHELIDNMQLKFVNNKIYLNDKDVTEELRQESVGMLASKYASMEIVRTKLLDFQREFAKKPGLVTDGRDMGSVVFSEASLKIFLIADAVERAKRRHKQLQQLKKSDTIEAILQDIIARDKLDSQRSVAPLQYDSTFKVLDNSNLSIEKTLAIIKNWYFESIT